MLKFEDKLQFEHPRYKTYIVCRAIKYNTEVLVYYQNRFHRTKIVIITYKPNKRAVNDLNESIILARSLNTYVT